MKQWQRQCVRLCFLAYPAALPALMLQALQNYKFKVKLTPGTVKKGKAARQALELLVRAPEAAQREKELLKAIPEMDMVNAMVSHAGTAPAGGCLDKCIGTSVKADQ